MLRVKWKNKKKGGFKMKWKKEVSTVEIDGVLYEKHEDREGVTFTPVELKTHKLEFTERELNIISNLIYANVECRAVWEEDISIVRFSDQALAVMRDINDALYAYTDEHCPGDPLAGIQSDFEKVEWKNCGDQQ